MDTEGGESYDQGPVDDQAKKIQDARDQDWQAHHPEHSFLDDLAAIAESCDDFAFLGMS